MKNNLFIIVLVCFLSGCSAQSEGKVYIEGKEVLIFDPGSEFFHESIKKRLAVLDTTLTAKHVLAYTHYVQQTAPFDPKELDLKAAKMYEMNEKGQYQKALETGRELLSFSPNNITALKEMGYAFKRLGHADSVQIYFNLMVKAIEGAKLSGDGGIESPYILNNSFELTSLIEATTKLYAEKSAVWKDSKGRILVLGMVKSPRMGHFALLNHWSKYLKKGEYLEGDFDEEYTSER